MKLLCHEHANSPQLICLHPSCTSRLMCLLCQHNHELFESVRKVNQVKIDIFQKKVDSEIDKSIAIIEELQAGGISTQKQLIQQFYETIKADLQAMLERKKKENIRILTHNSNSDMGSLIKARIQGRYHQLPSETFAKIKQVWEGKDLVSLAREQKKISLQNAYNQMKRFHQECSELFSKFDSKLKCKIPEIRLTHQIKSTIIQENYDEQLPATKLKQTLICETKSEIFSSLISDCYSGNSEIISVGFDKTLRVFDKKLNLIAENQFGNILMRIHSIAPEIYAVGVSKQLHIAKISESNHYVSQKILVLRHHKERILDIHSLNSRIIGSCSDQGTKIWDLYKQKCQYTIKEQTNPSCLCYLPGLKNISIGYHSHEIKVYGLEKVRPIRCYFLEETPLCLSQENRNQNLIYSSGFRSSLALFDIRLSKQVMKHDFKSEAITCMKQSIFQQSSILLGERGGKARIFDLRKLKTRLQWEAHQGMTNLSRPNGIVKVFEQSSGLVLTAGCNDQRLALWALQGA